MSGCGLDSTRSQEKQSHSTYEQGNEPAGWE
jgi:hypothetical protein